MRKLVVSARTKNGNILLRDTTSTIRHQASVRQTGLEWMDHPIQERLVTRLLDANAPLLPFAQLLTPANTRKTHVLYELNEVPIGGSAKVHSTSEIAESDSYFFHPLGLYLFLYVSAFGHEIFVAFPSLLSDKIGILLVHSVFDSIHATNALSQTLNSLSAPLQVLHLFSTYAQQAESPPSTRQPDCLRCLNLQEVTRTWVYASESVFWFCMYSSS